MNFGRVSQQEGMGGIVADAEHLFQMILLPLLARHSK